MPICCWIARARGLKGFSSSLTMEKWLWSFMARTSAAGTRHAAAATDGWKRCTDLFDRLKA